MGHLYSGGTSDRIVVEVSAASVKPDKHEGGFVAGVPTMLCWAFYSKCYNLKAKFPPVSNTVIQSSANMKMGTESVGKGQEGTHSHRSTQHLSSIPGAVAPPWVLLMEHLKSSSPPAIGHIKDLQQTPRIVIHICENAISSLMLHVEMHAVLNAIACRRVSGEPGKKSYESEPMPLLQAQTISRVNKNIIIITMPNCQSLLCSRVTQPGRIIELAMSLENDASLDESFREDSEDSTADDDCAD